MGDNDSYMKIIIDEAESIKIVGIIRPNPSAVATSLNGAIGYTPSLTKHIIDKVNSSEIVTSQLADEKTDVINGLPFDDGTNGELSEEEQAEVIRSALNKMTAAERAAVYTEIASAMPDEAAMAQAAEQTGAMPEEQLKAMLLSAMKEKTGMDDEAISSYLSSMSSEDIYAYATAAVAESIKAQYAEQAQAQLGAMSTDELSAMLDVTLDSLTDSETVLMLADYLPQTISDSTYEENLELLGYADLSKPSSISIYCKTFEDKDSVAKFIEDYNRSCTSDGRDEDIINYTDYVALMMSSISTIINVISYVLIAFVSISLVVSSIMIGIITYISVLERTKEIGILRAIGASKKDVSRVFNAETLIIGFSSGAIGIIVTLLLCIPANIIIEHLTDIANIAQLPTIGGVILVLISMVLTMIAGLIPSRVAAKKDPVIALRSE